MPFGTPAASSGSTTVGTNASCAPNDHNVAQAGNDGISSLIWAPNNNYLVGTNWDGGVRCWEVQESGGRVQAVPKAQGKLIHPIHKFLFLISFLRTAFSLLWVTGIYMFVGMDVFCLRGE